MTITIDATYEDGVLKPAQPLPLSEHARVRVTVEEQVSLEASEGEEAVNENGLTLITSRARAGANASRRSVAARSLHLRHSQAHRLVGVAGHGIDQGKISGFF